MKGRKLLDALIVLAVAFALPIFYLIEKIIEFCGNGGDDDKKNLRGFSPIPPDDDSPPTRAAVIFVHERGLLPDSAFCGKARGGEGMRCPRCDLAELNSGEYK